MVYALLGCGVHMKKQDGYCDDANNNEECQFDGGDCCGSDVKYGKCDSDAENGCQCLDPRYKGIEALPNNK